MEKRKVKGRVLDRIILMAIAVATALLVLNNVMLLERGIKVAEAKEILKEQLRPAELTVIKITQDNCDSCFDIEKAMDELKSQNVNITNEETISSSSQQGRELVSAYGIKKLPTIIVSGEINKSEQLADYFGQKGEISENEFIYTGLAPPYFDVVSSHIRGRVQIKHLVDSSCEQCVDISPISSALREQGVYIQDEQFIEYNSDEGREVISEFGIKEIPAVLISDEIEYYPEIKDALLQSGASKEQGMYAVHSTLPPYRNLSQNRVVGLVDIMYVTKEDCPVCYDVSVNRNILLRFGMVLNKENTHDTNAPEGRQLVQKYSIKKVPIIILSPDAEQYPALVQAWRSVGTIENDGWFVMRNPEVIGTYWDLERDRVVEADS